MERHFFRIYPRECVRWSPIALLYSAVYCIDFHIKSIEIEAIKHAMCKVGGFFDVVSLHSFLTC